MFSLGRARLALLAPVGVSALKAHDEPEATSAITADSTAVRKVVTLIEEMKVQAEKDAAADKTSYDKYMCWCKTNEEEKTAAIADAEKLIDELTALLEELAATEARLKVEISGLEQDIAEDQDALASATATREKEKAAFLAEETDLKETLGLLKEAYTVLDKVQLLQKEGKGNSAEAARVQAVLLQFKEKVQQMHPKFQSVMQRDLFDVLGSMDAFPHQHDSFLPRRSAALVEQKGSLLPWEKTDEQIGMESKSTDLVGAAANAKSYNSRSGRILGLLKEMGDETARDLADAQKEDFKAEVSYQNLRAAKISEIRVATEQKKRKEAQLADTINQAAKAKKDKEATEDALEADQAFLANMLKDCKTEDEQYQKRAEIRSQEVVALGETLKILNADEARDLFGKTVTLLQISQSSEERASTQDRVVERVMQRIAAVAKKHKNWALVSLAVRVRLDAFTKVKEVMDKMLAELSKQQKEEYSKWELCKSNIDKTEDDIKVGEQTKEDLDEKHKQIVSGIERLNNEIDALKTEEEEMKVSLKAAGEQRKEQNGLFQTSVMDQRATTNILQKALARLKMFYTPGFVQKPGQPSSPEPAKGQAYQKSAGAGGVVQLLMKIIENSEVEEQQLAQDEQRAQELYGEFVQSATATIEADRAGIAEKSAQVVELEGAKAETEEAQLANDAQLTKLADLLNAHHLDCDYLLKYFDIRQQARAEEMDAITDAKAVLSGADFGK